MATVDIVIPCYKYGHYLENCVISVLSQRDVDVRILIVDDASPDDTPSVAERLMRQDQRVHYQRNSTNLGLIPTVNCGVMDWATADYVVVLSADDALSPGSLARATHLMEANPHVSMTYGMALVMQDAKPPLESDDIANAPCEIIPGHLFIQRICSTGNAVPTPCAVMRTSVQHRIGGYDSIFPHTSDVDTWMRAAAAGPIGVVNAIQGFYRWHSTNMSAAYQRRPIGDRRELVFTCRNFERRFGSSIPEFSSWVENMEKRFAKEALWIASTSYDRQGDDTWQDSISFVKQYDCNYWRSLSWWKFILKRMIGRDRARALKNFRIRNQRAIAVEETTWYEHGAEIGWWPRADEQRF